MMRKQRALVLIGFLLVGGLTPSFASSVIPMNLADLVQRASRVFEGRCIGVAHETVRTADGAEMPVVVYTFEVADRLQGISGDTVSISHLGKFQDGRRFFADPDLIGVPRYEVGGSYILFVNHDSGTTGLSVPIGFHQGVFRVQGGKAIGGVDNDQIMKGMKEPLQGTPHLQLLPGTVARKQDTAAGGFDKDAFKALVRDMIAGKIQAPTLAEVRQ